MDSKSQESRNYISEENLVELGVSRELWESWYYVMDSIYAVGQHLYPDKISNIENIVRIGDSSISGTLSHSQDHIELKVSKEGIQYLSIRYNNNIGSVVSAIFAIVQDLEGQEGYPNYESLESFEVESD